MKKFLIALAVVATPALAQVPTFTTSSQTYTPLDANSPGYTYALLPAGDAQRRNHRRLQRRG